MSRRTFPRAVAASLLVAALGGPAAGQTLNPWRGETGLPTAPAPRAVKPQPTRSLSIGLGYNSVGGLTATIEIRTLTPPAPAPVKAPRVLKLGGTATRALPAGWFVEPLPTPRYLERYPTYFPPDPTFPLPRELAGMIDPDAAARGRVVPASHVLVPTYMPPPAPLPVQRIPLATP